MQTVIHCLCLTSRLTYALHGDHVQPIKNGNVSIECRFGTPLETAINIVVLGELAPDYEHSQE